MSKPRTPKNAETVDTTASDTGAVMHLDVADMHKLFHLASKVERLAANIGTIQRDAQVDELNLKVAQEQLQRLQAEFANRNQRRLGDIQQLNRLQTQAADQYTAFKQSLSEKYGVDLDQTTIDDETGRIVIVPVPVPEPAAS